LERTAGNQGMIKENNQKFIIDTLVSKGPTSRADLAKILKLSAPSVSNNINQLLKKKILLEIGEGDSIGGRRPILLEFNYNYGYIVGIDLSSQDLKIALSNLKPEIIETRTIDISNIKIGKNIVNLITENISDILNNNNLKPEQLLVICLGFPGIINEETGRLVVLPLWLYVWDEVNIKEEIKKKFTVEVIIKNDINLAALGECHYGVGRDYKNLVYVSVDMGVGAGVILNNILYEGVRLAAGEIGYFSSTIEDLNLDNKNIGPLESRIAIPGIIANVKKSLSEGELSLEIARLVDGDIEKIDLKVIETAIKLRDPYIIKEMERITRELGIILANISILLDLELVILGGKLIDLGYNFLDPLSEITGKLIPLNTKVIYSSLDQKAVIYGAFAAALENVYNNILSI
jgi:predicted NBD/HSP70 family sugar kinase